MVVVKYYGARAGEEPLRTARGLRYFSTGVSGDIIDAARKVYAAYNSPTEDHPVGILNGMDIYLIRQGGDRNVHYPFRVWIDNIEGESNHRYMAVPIQVGRRRSKTIQRRY